MVWGLFPDDPHSGEDEYYIFRKGSYRVGRKGCDVSITKDKGVSRVHAEIVVTAMATLNSSNSETSTGSSKIYIKDCSKYGTFISKKNGPKKKAHELPNREAILEDGDLICFGTGTATYRFCFVPLVFYICCSDHFEVDQSLQDQIASIGGRISHTLNEECTHALVDQVKPVNQHLLDAIIAKMPIILSTWVEIIAGKNICNEIPSFSSYFPMLTVEGTSVPIGDPKNREKCLGGYTFLLDPAHMYKSGYQFQSLLEAGGANVILIGDFSKVSDYGDDNHFIYVIPGGYAEKSDRLKKLTSLSRVNEMDILCAVLRGQLDPSKLISPCVPVSLSCSTDASTDETVVADSEAEDETATSIHVNDAVEKGVIILDDDTTKSVSNEKISLAVTRSSLNVYSAAVKEDSSNMTVTKAKGDESESRNSDIIYSQDLVVRHTNGPLGTIDVKDNGVPNFKCFRKVQTQSGNSFDNLVPFSKYPYKDFDYGSENVVEAVKEEKKRKQVEAIAEDLFNNEKSKRRGTAGSLCSILT